MSEQARAYMEIGRKKTFEEIKALVLEYDIEVITPRAPAVGFVDELERWSDTVVLFPDMHIGAPKDFKVTLLKEREHLRFEGIADAMKIEGDKL